MNVETARPLKADFHLHTAEDPVDVIQYGARELIARAADESFEVLAITNHQQITFNGDLFSFAQERGILLIPGVETKVQGRHVLILNPPSGENCSDFASLAAMRSPETFIIAPHPFYPGTTSLHRELLQHLRLFDALEYSHFYSRMINYNQRAEKLSRSGRIPLIGTSDCHFFSQLGTTYSLIYAEKNMADVFAAIRRNRIRIMSRPLTHVEMSLISAKLSLMKIRSLLIARNQQGHLG